MRRCHVIEPVEDLRSATEPAASNLRVLPGEYRTTQHETLVTVLGSCVAACVRNPRTGFGGINHFMLPESDTGNWNGFAASTRYGNFAMGALIRDVLASGCDLADLEVKIFGGAELYPCSIPVGSRNVTFISAYLAELGIRPAAQDLGGRQARKILYTPTTGRVLRLLIDTH